MAASTEQNLLSEMLPKVIIDKIILSNTTEEQLKINLKLIVKETLDNDFFGTWFDSVNIKKYISILAVQSRDVTLTRALSFANDMVLLCNPTYTLNPNDIKTQALGFIFNNNNLQNLSEILKTHSRTHLITISRDSDGDNNIDKYQSYVDTNGNKIYEIPYDVNFEIEQVQPEHLSYFVTTIINLEQFCSDFGINYNTAKELSSIGKTSCEVVINDNKTVSTSYVFLDEDNFVWDGPVYQDSQANWRKGTGESEVNSSILQVIESTNTKLQDFRNIPEIQKNIFNFSDVELFLEKVYSGIKQKSDKTPITDKEVIFTDITLSPNLENSICYSFSVNFFNILKHNSKFSNLFYSDNNRFKNEAIQNIKISNLKLLRRRVKNNIKIHTNIADYEPEQFDVNQSDYVVVNTKDSTWKKINTINEQKGSISEVILSTSAEIMPDEGIRFFHGVDKQVLQNTDGIYQYGIELEIEDGIQIFIENKLNKLEASKNRLIKYYNDILLEKDGYNNLSNKLSQELINKLYLKYQTSLPNFSECPWNEPIATFVDVLDIFNENIKTQADRIREIDKLSVYLSPQSASPDSIFNIIQLFDYFISSINNYLGLSTISNNTSDLPVKSFKNLKIVYYFKNLLDVNALSNLPMIDYLSTANTEQYNNLNTGLTEINLNIFKERIKNETIKYFKNESPNLSLQDGNNNINFDFLNASYSFLSPTRIDFKNMSYMLSDIEINPKINNIKNIYYLNNLNIKGDYSYLNLHSMFLENKFTNLDGRIAASRQAKKLVSKTLNNSENLLKTLENQTANRVSEIFSNLDGMTLKKIEISNEKDERNVNSQELKELNSFQQTLEEIDANELYGFFSSLTNPIISNFSRKNMKNKSVKNINKSISRISKDSIKEISSIKPQFLVNQKNKIIVGFKNPISQEQFNMIPNQLKGIILKSSELKTELINNLQFNDFKQNMMNKQKNYYNFNMLAVIEYLSGFEKNLDTNETNINKPIWKTFTKESADKMIDRKQIICRMKSYTNNNLNISMNMDVENNSYDKYFIINNETFVNNNMPKITEIDSTAIINQLIEQIVNQIPNVNKNSIPNSIEVKNKTIIPQKFEITKIDSNNNKETITITPKQIENIIPSSYSEEMKIRMSTTIKQLQNSYIKNSEKTTLQIPSKNIGINKNSMKNNKLKAP